MIMIGSAMVTAGSEQAMRGILIVCWGEETICLSHRIVIPDDVIVFRGEVMSCRWAAKAVTSTLGSTRGSLTTWTKDHALMGRRRHTVTERRVLVTAAAMVSSDSVVVITDEVTMIGKLEEADARGSNLAQGEAMT
jgi:membrane protein YqaA with SNARE-associated domain